MAETAKNKNLQEAKRNKKDEFYTQLSDIERELKYYKHHFKNKVVYYNCDDPRVSNFFHFFSYNFEKLGLKKLIATCYKNQSMDLFSQNDSSIAFSLRIYVISLQKSSTIQKISVTLSLENISEIFSYTIKNQNFNLLNFSLFSYLKIKFFISNSR